MTAVRRAAALLRDIAADIKRTHSFSGEWQVTDQDDEVAMQLHDAAIQVAAELDDQPAGVCLDPHHARARLALANLAGAVAALANEIVVAGGYHIADPARRERLDRAMSAVSRAHAEALAVPAITHTGDCP